MRIRRTVPPAAARLDWRDLMHAVTGLVGRDPRGTREAELKAYFGVKHVFLVSSGTAALYLILAALKSMSPRRSVLMPAYTCFSVPSAVVKAGLDVDLCDIEPATLDLDDEYLERSIGDHTLCVIATHLFGIPAEMARLRGRCRMKGTFLVEDAAQAMGGSRSEGKLGTLGDVGFFSLGRGKNITAGAGGIIVTNSDAIAGRIEEHYCRLRADGVIRTMRRFLELLVMKVFIRPTLFWLPAGLPFLHLGETKFSTDFEIDKLSRLQGGLLRRWREHLETSRRARTTIAAEFEQQLGLQPRAGGSIGYVRLPLLVTSPAERTRLHDRSRELGLGVSSMYPTSVNEIAEMRHRFGDARFPGARQVAATLLTLPTHHLLSARDRARIGGALLSVSVESPRTTGVEAGR